MRDIYPRQRLRGGPPNLIETVMLGRAAPGGTAPGGAARWEIPFRVIRQAQSLWCWAAVSSSVAEYFGTNGWSQCRVASAEMGGDCCTSGGSAQCNRWHYLESALQRVEHFRDAAPGHLTPQAIADELDADLPVCLRVQWWNGEGHFLAIHGMIPHGNDPILLLTDPIYGRAQVQGSVLLNSGYQGAARGRWTHSYVVQR